jgi:hypothetical protein
MKILKMLRVLAAAPFQTLAGILAFVTLAGILMVTGLYAIVILIEGEH